MQCFTVPLSRKVRSGEGFRQNIWVPGQSFLVDPRTFQRPKLLLPSDTKKLAESAGARTDNGVQRRRQREASICGVLNALAFLSLTEGMNYTRQYTPTGNGLEALVDLVDYIDATYVTGSIRRIQRPVASHRIQRLRIRLTPPSFPSSLWNVHNVTLAGAITPTTCASRGTAPLQVSSVIIIRRCGRLLKFCSKMTHWRQGRSSRSLGDSRRSRE